MSNNINQNEIQKLEFSDKNYYIQNLEDNNFNTNILPITEKNLNNILNTEEEQIINNLQKSSSRNEHIKENLNNLNISENIPKTKDIEDSIQFNTSKNKPILKYNLCRVLLLTIHASTGFFFFGYNLACFNTMQENLSIILKWTENNKTIFISIISAVLPFGSIFGAIFSGKICAKIGRRYSFILINLIGILSTLLSLITNTYTLILAKLIQGFCVGSFSTIVPLYVNEYVPNNLSGMCGIIYNTNFCLGILMSFLFGLNLPTNSENILNDNWWRFMFFFSSIPNLINTLLMIFVFKYDTPLYLINRIKENDEEIKNKTKMALKFIYKENYVENIFEELISQINNNPDNNTQQVTYKILCSKKYFKRLIILITLNIFQQLTLINPIGLYSNLLFLKSTTQQTATLFTALTGVAELIGSLMTIFTIEKFGRKTLFLFGFSLTFVCHLTVGILYHFNYSEPQRYIIVFFYFLCGISVDPIIWIYNADVLPDKGVGICTMTNWIIAVITIASFPFLISSGLKPEGTFILFGSITLIGCIFAILFMKESKGKSIVEIEDDYK